MATSGEPRADVGGAQQQQARGGAAHCLKHGGFPLWTGVATPPCLDRTLMLVPLAGKAVNEGLKHRVASAMAHGRRLALTQAWMHVQPDPARAGIESYGSLLTAA